MESNIATLDFAIQGMTCAACVRRVERTIAKVEGVAQVNVNLASESAHVELAEPYATSDLSAAVASLVIESIGKAGYQADLVRQVDEQIEQQTINRGRLIKSHRWHFIWALILSLPVFILEMGGHMIPAISHWTHQTLGMQNTWIVQWLLATAVLLGPGRMFFVNGYKSARSFSPDMNTLVALGSGAAYCYSVVVLWRPDLIPEQSRFVYFEAAVVVITLVLLGKLLEARSKGQTGQAVAKLLGMQAKTAHLVNADGSLDDINLQDLRAGQRVLVKPGETVPADGEIVNGESYVNESMFTGEPVHVLKTVGMSVIGGTVSTNNALTVLIKQVGPNTLLSQIIQMVQQAQAEKLPIQSILDKVTSWFVPAVMVVALFTFIIWLLVGPQPTLAHALTAAVSVLIIACPCAMGLAVPVSIMVGIGRAAQMNVLFRKSAALQQLRDVKVVVFDKTGTLTDGRPSLQSIRLFRYDILPKQVGDTLAGNESEIENTLLSEVAAIENQSEHPIALAIVNAAQELGLQLPNVFNFQNYSGYGISGEVNGHKYLLGSATFLQSQSVQCDQAITLAQEWAEQGMSPIYVARDSQCTALLGIADQLKSDAKSTIDKMRQMGLQTIMITGDYELTARAIAQQLGIDLFYAQTLPGEKAKLLASIRQQSGLTAFVGDGVNDAPALARADVGIAIGSGTDIAIESADVVLIGRGLHSVLQAIGISKATIRNIHQNLFWAFAYNVLLIPLAAGALYPLWGIVLSPVFAGVAMAISSFFVVMNALRLKNYKA